MARPRVTTPLRVGVVGCGVISATYLGNRFSSFEVVACADVDTDRARGCAAAHGIEALPLPDLLADPSIDCILDLTPPAAHFEVGLAAIQAGKHLYQEKPLAVRLDHGQVLLAAAEERRVRVGCAPDTFLGAGLRTVQALVDDGVLGDPVAATLTMLNGGPERWHPDPAFFYAEGAGPLFDVGPYHLTAAVVLLGPVVGVTGASRRLRAARRVGSGPLAGDRIPVEVDTSVWALLEHRSGAVSVLVTSFDAPARARCALEIHGTAASLEGPDPNEFGGTVVVRRHQADDEPVPLLGGVIHNARGIGLADMAEAIVAGRPHRASGTLALHVLEVMHAVLAAARTGRRVEIAISAEHPEPLPNKDRANGA